MDGRPGEGACCPVSENCGGAVGLKEIEIWGDGKQTRSFCYIDDCITGIHKLMRSGYREPLNLGQDRMVPINELADIIMGIAGIQLNKRHAPGPEGVRDA